MAAPIQRYSDPRLYGEPLVRGHARAYAWIRTIANPIHPNCSLVAEVAFRAFKALTGILALGVTIIPALVGRGIQIVHYHMISSSSRLDPQQQQIHGISLPKLSSCPMPAPAKFHGTKPEYAISILRWGFDPSRTAVGSRIANAVYVSAKNVVSADYGEDQLIVSLDLKEKEIAYLDDKSLAEFWRQAPRESDSFEEKKQWMATVRELFLRNGYRAIRYNLSFYGTEEAWAVYDESCISIQKIQRSPEVVAPPSLCHEKQELLVCC